MKLTQVFTALVTLTFISAVQASWCYCSRGNSGFLEGATKSVCTDFTGTDRLRNVPFGKHIYCDIGPAPTGSARRGEFYNLCKAKGADGIYCR